MKASIPRHCRHHAEQPTRWYCDSCQLPLCTRCKPFAEQLPLEAPCPLCGRALRDIEAHPDGVPGPLALLASPLDPLALVPIALLAAAFGLLPWPLPAVLVAVPVAIVLLAYLITQATSTAEGDTRRPKLHQFRDIDHLEYCLQTLPFALPVIALPLAALATGSAALVGLAIAVASALVPAILMATIIEGSAKAAFSPSAVGRVVQILDKRYLEAAFLTLAPVGLIALLALLLAELAPPPLLRAGLAAAAGWLAISWSRYIGLTLYLNRRRLDYPAGVAPIDRPRRPVPAVYEPAQLVADADTLLSEGRKQDARRHLGRALTRYPDDPELNRRFDLLVREKASAGEFANHLERRMQRLMSNGQVAEATDLWQRNSPTMANWLPRITETRYRLALELDERGEHQTAFRLLIGLPPDDGKPGRIAHAWREAARILEHHLDDPKRARELRRIAAEKDPSLTTAANDSGRPHSRPAARSRKDLTNAGTSGDARVGRPTG